MAAGAEEQAECLKSVNADAQCSAPPDIHLYPSDLVQQLRVVLAQLTPAIGVVISS